MWIIIWLRVEKLNIYWIVFHVGDHRPGRGHITDLFSWFYLLFAGELVGPHFWPMSVARPENSQNFCDQREIPPSPSTQCSATDTKLDNNWKCQQGLICPFNWAFQRSHSTCMQAWLVNMSLSSPLIGQPPVSLGVSLSPCVSLMSEC